ncbi:MAG: hypothetical protein ABIN55_01475 [Aeromicrobium sp.]
MYTRSGIGGYVRMITPPSCGRCVVQAGKWFRFNQGFERHPECDCRHIPAAESIAGDLLVDPHAYFDSLDEAAQIKMVGSIANAQAVRDGADIGQIVNAYGRTSGMRFAQVSPIKIDKHGDKFTLAGTTRRADAFKQQLALRRNGTPRARVMPETIARIAKDDADRIRLLKLYGWIRDDEAIGRGRAILAEQRRLEHNARAAERRAKGSKSTNRTPQTATGAGAGGRGPTKPPGPRSPFGSDPADKSRSQAYWKARQDAIDVDFGGEHLDPHEVVFVEDFLDAGHRIEWIPRDQSGRHPTNDFRWLSRGGVEIEVKGAKAKYTTIQNAIHDAVKRARVNHGFVKDHFIIDLANQPFTDRLRSELADYNLNRSRYVIRRLWVWHQGQLEELELRE